MFTQFQNYQFLQIQFLGNSTFDWLTAFFVFFIILLLLKLFKTFLIVKIKKISQKTQTKLDDIVVDAINKIHWPFYIFISIYTSFNFLNIPEIVNKSAYYIFLVLTTYYAVKIIQEFINFGAEEMVNKKSEDNS